jgi:hypothetical protein
MKKLIDLIIEPHVTMRGKQETAREDYEDDRDGRNRRIKELEFCIQKLEIGGVSG